jgi:hypothetical protein
MKETKALVTKVVGASNAAPGPGAHDLKDPPPLAQAPSLKGRELGHGMPAPFAYNCKPDLSRRFMTPLREQNSAAQIFGRDHREADSRDGPGGNSLGASGPDQLPPQEMPLSLMQEDPMQDEAAQWKPGFFQPIRSGIRRTQSSGALVGDRSTAKEAKAKKDHPVVEQTKSFYKVLSRNMGRKLEDRTFLPGCHKRNNGHEPVGVAEHSLEYRRLQEGKSHLAAMSDQLLQVSSSLLEPLDEGKLQEQAIQGLKEKARERMRFEGVAPDQQDLVLAELSSVVEEQFSSN